jgi:molybdopterin converting factor small subunit
VEPKEVTMSVKVKIPALFQFATNGIKTTEVNCSTIGECFKKLCSEYPSLKKMLFDEKDKLASNLIVSINGKIITENVLSAPVKPGDEVLLGMIIDGG